MWEEVQPTVECNIYGPHLEDLAREWTAFHAAPGTLGGIAAQTVGGADIACREHRGHQVDVLAMHGDRVVALGEAKWRAVTAADVERLRHIRDVTPHAGGARLVLFTGGRTRLQSAGDVEIVDLERLYTGS